ncbi:1-phosphatidylinositol-4-phosphate 5-kinase [Purpureocillium takamizusanense]|uniref:1-phosphatidylinositol-4-phosphate 5-kinase n=1 Tax=Purpureocillium takamizusanense TaxID=2060973 RepID=A0A9Q8QE83_9HYPO|nr:1-phosphatidylinositol-4-phosphate 5-kinase [Purpureocillium takamizusanense]UNI17878.1 1-phosphatidylinositol-4-phosphate 5-kinase [Purpureocillium takamizusanense]
MPSFLTDTTFSDIEVLDLDPDNRFGLDGKKTVNGGPVGHGRPGIVNGSYDEGSTLSTRDSDVSETIPMPVSSGTRPTSMGSTNGHSVFADADDVRDVTPRARPANGLNGSVVLPDRTAPRPPADTNHHDHHDGRESPESPTTPRKLLPASHSEQRPGEHSPTGKGSPHRFSSPPAYQPVPNPLSTSPSGHLQPPSSLKQRHTLEVPKLPPGRQSKDGFDAHASGRFSPSVAGSTGTRRASLNLVRRTTRSMQSDGPRDEIVPDEDAIRWAEAYRQKRASKRKRKEEEDDDRVLVGTKVDESHANWVTAYNMLTGIRVSVSRTNAKLDRELTPADFEAKQKSTFDITGNELVPSAKYDFKFKDYAPWVFRRLRSLFRLDPADYLMSLTGKYILSELGSPGKSGSFFYFSRDYKYIIKTIHHAEHKFLRKILREYYDHVQANPNTLLSQFYGLHRVKMPYGKKIHFVVMNNLFPPHRDIHTTFDLKGSTVGRDYREEDLAKNPRATLKDLNWLRRQQHLELGIQKKRMFLEQLQQDVVLLKRLQIMDYSLLIGIHDLSRGNEENLRGKTLQVFNPGGEKSTADDDPHTTGLLRTPSKLESVRKARELRQMIRQERPVPMGQALDKMPDELEEGHSRSGFVFNQDDGGFRATHEDNSPADEIYYLGVIDCLTHYGMIKKIEHFWKGLSHDRTQISALPPEQYGDRFYNFVEGITMSAEEARREAQRRDLEALEAVAATSAPHRSSTQRFHGIPPMPEHQPPPVPSGPRSPEARETVDMANKEALKSVMSGASEREVPDRTLRTNVPDKREPPPHEPVLPIVEETGEQRSDADEARDVVPPPPTGPPPPTPPKREAPPRPDGSDSGYGGNSNGTVSRDNSLNVRSPRSKESLDKNLPPLPNSETRDSGVRMAA